VDITVETVLSAAFDLIIFDDVSLITYIYLVHLFGTLLDFLTSDMINSGLLSEKETSFTLWSVDFRATVWKQCLATCCTENKSIYQLSWFIKLWKLRVCVNTNGLVHARIIFQTQMPPYKLDTSIACCIIMVSTSDVSKKQIGDMANLDVRRHGWWEGTSEWRKALHQSGSCFVWKW